ncbi:class I SAM-dependent methyltransferase [Simkania negevensis]|uniref:Methyltransferase type 11 n=1 Tax=Simkania negevensis (strain ATCC VR-1471 / DSM 27360 / Z) TaxID=331113 RepID=F8L972_SIMNZ|nr:class I SAM-dependent methyltransferase [Simkania negevensis]MCB1075671.1 class I SAM-dependent methyltransferase [Simkania sp.]CCB89387.1 methyltransferase type 11 [Simkania negevensis Z]
MDGQTYWGTIGFQKEFEDPFPLEKLKTLFSKDALVVEYGCGYGRLLKQMQQVGFTNLLGFDYSSKMVERGKALYPSLDLRHIPNSGHIPLSDEKADLLIASTILCCLTGKEELSSLFHEFHRVLKNGGTLYLFDFLLSNHPSSLKKYEQGFNDHGEWGVYTTTEGLTVPHFQTGAIMNLNSGFISLILRDFSLSSQPFYLEKDRLALPIGKNTENLRELSLLRLSKINPESRL